MQRIKSVINQKPKYNRTPDAWVKQSPELLTDPFQKLKKREESNAEKAGIATKKVIKQMKFEVVAWGFDKNNVNRPFSPTEQINIPCEKRVYFKLKYKLPPNVRSLIWLRASTSYIGSPSGAHKGEGELVGVLAASKPSKENKFKIIVRLLMPNSRSETAAELPCNIIWESAENQD